MGNSGFVFTKAAPNQQGNTTVIALYDLTVDDSDIPFLCRIRYDYRYAFQYIVSTPWLPSRLPW